MGHTQGIKLIRKNVFNLDRILLALDKSKCEEIIYGLLLNFQVMYLLDLDGLTK